MGLPVPSSTRQNKAHGHKPRANRFIPNGTEGVLACVAEDDGDKQVSQTSVHSVPASTPDCNATRQKRDLDPLDNIVVSKRQAKKNKAELEQRSVADAQQTLAKPFSRLASWRDQIAAKNGARDIMKTHSQRQMRKGQDVMRSMSNTHYDKPRGPILRGQGTLVPSIGSAEIPGKITFATIQPGMIVARPDRQRLLPNNSKVKMGDKGTYYVHDRYVMHEKDRLFITSTCYPNLVGDVPILTKGDTGLKHIPQHEWDQYMLVRPRGCTDFVPQCPDMKVLEIEYDYGHRKMNRRTMVVHIARVHFWQETDFDKEDWVVAGRVTLASATAMNEGIAALVGKNSVLEKKEKEAKA